MKKNMGSIDKIIRLVIAVTILVLYVTETITGVSGTVLLLLAAIFATTGFISFCPLYLPFGLSTRRNKNT